MGILADLSGALAVAVDEVDADGAGGEDREADDERESRVHPDVHPLVHVHA